MRKKEKVKTQENKKKKGREIQFEHFFYSFCTADNTKEQQKEKDQQAIILLLFIYIIFFTTIF